MRRLLYTILISWLVFSLMNACSFKNAPRDETDLEVESLLADMSLEEKVGQMTQVTIDMILKEESTTEIDQEKLRVAIVEKKVGSILNVKGHAYKLEEWHRILFAIQDMAMKETNNQIPVLYGIDAIHGANYISGATLFPHNIGMAATRNPELAEKAARVTALETRASGVRWNFDPVVGLGRQPLWSRFEETFGEDVYLTGLMGASVIKAYEKDGLKNTEAVASCMKHYLGYSVPASGKDRTPAYIPEVQLRELFLPPFAQAVDAGTSTVMINSGEVNGIPVHASEFLLKTLLREELGFDGVAVSDWEDIIRLQTRHHLADSQEEAVKLAVNAGIDMSMVPLDYSFYDILLDLAKKGEVSENRINEAVSRILKLKHKVGLFDNAYPEEDAIANFGKPEYEAIAKEAALQSITLLKNEEKTLPLATAKKILVAGPCAANVPALHGSWSFTWQGDAYDQYPESTLSIREALEARFGKQQVISRAHPEFDHNDNYNTQKLMADARSADAIVLCLGEYAYAEGPGVIDDLTLDQKQLALAEAAAKTGKPVVLVLIQGRPRIISSIESGMDAILTGYRPGSQGANAITEVLAGDYNPNGKLPFTYPKMTGDVILYDHKYSEGIREDIPNTYGGGAYRPQWPFGHGLSYTTFDYSDLKLDKKELGPNEELQVTVTLSNTGKTAGAHTVELYSSDLYASVTPSVKKLKGFKKVELSPGESEEVTFTLTPEDLSFINNENKRVTEPGTFKVTIGHLNDTFNYQD